MTVKGLVSSRLPFDSSSLTSASLPQRMRNLSQRRLPHLVYISVVGAERIPVFGRLRLLVSRTFFGVAFVVESHLAPIPQEQRHLPDRAYRRRQ